MRHIPNLLALATAMAMPLCAHALEFYEYLPTEIYLCGTEWASDDYNRGRSSFSFTSDSEVFTGTFTLTGEHTSQTNGNNYVAFANANSQGWVLSSTAEVALDTPIALTTSYWAPNGGFAILPNGTYTFTLDFSTGYASPTVTFSDASKAKTATISLPSGRMRELEAGKTTTVCLAGLDLNSQFSISWNGVYYIPESGSTFTLLPGTVDSPLTTTEALAAAEESDGLVTLTQPGAYTLLITCDESGEPTEINIGNYSDKCFVGALYFDQQKVIPGQKIYFGTTTELSITADMTGDYADAPLHVLSGVTLIEGEQFVTLSPLEAATGTVTVPAGSFLTTTFFPNEDGSITAYFLVETANVLSLRIHPENDTDNYRLKPLTWDNDLQSYTATVLLDDLDWVSNLVVDGTQYDIPEQYGIESDVQSGTADCVLNYTAGGKRGISFKYATVLELDVTPSGKKWILSWKRSETIPEDGYDMLYTVVNGTEKTQMVFKNGQWVLPEPIALVEGDEVTFVTDSGRRYASDSSDPTPMSTPLSVHYKAGSAYPYTVPEGMDGNWNINFYFIRPVATDDHRFVTFTREYARQYWPDIYVVREDGSKQKFTFELLRDKFAVGVTLNGGERIQLLAVYPMDDRDPVYLNIDGFTNLGVVTDISVTANDETTASADGSWLVAPEEGGDFVLRLLCTDDHHYTLEVETPEYPEALYLVFPANYNSETGAFADWIRLPQDVDKHGLYSTVGATTSGTANVANRIKDGQLKLYNGDVFSIYSSNNAKQGIRFGQNLLNYGVDNTSFEGGKDVRMMMEGEIHVEHAADGDKYYLFYDDSRDPDAHVCEEGVTHCGMGDWTVPNDAFPLEGTEYEDLDQLAEMIVDLRTPTKRYYRWGSATNYEGYAFYLYGDCVDKADQESETYRFVFHPETGLYTLTVDEVYGRMNIQAKGEGHDFLYGGLLGNEMIDHIGVVYDLYNQIDPDGFYMDGYKPSTAGEQFMINDNDYAWETTWISNGELGAVYRDVTFVFDPEKHQLWVFAARPGDDTKLHEAEIDYDNDMSQMYVVFCRQNEDTSFEYVTHYPLYPTEVTGYYVSGVYYNPEDPDFVNDPSQFDGSGWIVLDPTETAPNTSKVTPAKLVNDEPVADTDKASENYNVLYYFFTHYVYPDFPLKSTFHRAVHYGASQKSKIYVTEEQYPFNPNGDVEHETYTQDTWVRMNSFNSQEDVAIETIRSNDEDLRWMYDTRYRAGLDYPDEVPHMMMIENLGNPIFIEFDESTTQVESRITRWNPEPLYLVFDTEDTSVNGLYEQPDTYELVEDAYNRYTTENLIQFKDNDGDRNTHFFFSASPQGNLREIITRSANWRAEDTSSLTRQLEFETNDRGRQFTNFQPLVRTSHRSFLLADAEISDKERQHVTRDVDVDAPEQDATPTTVTGELADDLNLFYAPESGVKDIYGLINGDPYVVEQTIDFYKVYVVYPGGEIPSTSELATTKVVLLEKVTETIQTGVEDVAQDSSDAITVKVEGHRLIVRGARLTSIHDAQGRAVATSLRGDVNAVLHTGMYVVNADGRAYKVLVQ